MEWFIGIVIVLVIVGAFSSGSEEKKLKQAYDNALNGSDKKAALNAGRAYYSKLRKGKLTMYDEQALTNDISTMK
jgi:hypothetical protein